MSLATIVLIACVVLLIGVIPAWLSSKGWSYSPGGLALAVYALPVLLLTGRL